MAAPHALDHTKVLLDVVLDRDRVLPGESLSGRVLMRVREPVVFTSLRLTVLGVEMVNIPYRHFLHYGVGDVGVHRGGAGAVAPREGPGPVVGAVNESNAFGGPGRANPRDAAGSPSLSLLRRGVDHRERIVYEQVVTLVGPLSHPSPSGNPLGPGRGGAATLGGGAVGLDPALPSRYHALAAPQQQYPVGEYTFSFHIPLPDGLTPSFVVSRHDASGLDPSTVVRYGALKSSCNVSGDNDVREGGRGDHGLRSDVYSYRVSSMGYTVSPALAFPTGFVVKHRRTFVVNHAVGEAQCRTLLSTARRKVFVSAFSRGALLDALRQPSIADPRSCEEVTTAGHPGPPQAAAAGLRLPTGPLEGPGADGVVVVEVVVDHSVVVLADGEAQSRERRLARCRLRDERLDEVLSTVPPQRHAAAAGDLDGDAAPEPLRSATFFSTTVRQRAALENTRGSCTVTPRMLARPEAGGAAGGGGATTLPSPPQAMAMQGPAVAMRFRVVNQSATDTIKAISVSLENVVDICTRGNAPEPAASPSPLRRDRSSRRRGGAATPRASPKPEFHEHTFTIPIGKPCVFACPVYPQSEATFSATFVFPSSSYRQRQEQSSQLPLPTLFTQFINSRYVLSVTFPKNPRLLTRMPKPLCPPHGPSAHRITPLPAAVGLSAEEVVEPTSPSAPRSTSTRQDRATGALLREGDPLLSTTDLLLVVASKDPNDGVPAQPIRHLAQYLMGETLYVSSAAV